MKHMVAMAVELRTTMRPAVGQLLTVVLVGFVALALFVDGQDDGQTQELQVEIVSKPDNCDEAVTSQRGNILKMHYTGWLLDGTKFDSRLIPPCY